ncbi:MAG: hypothetical protein CBD18_03355 [Opitutales bacterium TMED158]|nr:MAG: hypothetical protein CBD18_03355 [Opitutales bacterium TMED158]
MQRGNEGIPVKTELTSEGMKLAPRLRRFVEKRIERLKGRYRELERVRLNFKRETPRKAGRSYSVNARLELPGHDRIVEKRSSNLGQALTRVLDVAERQLRKRNRQYKAGRREPAMNF